MRAVVLLSPGRHPVSGKPCLPRAEAQAARLAAGLDPRATGLHAGPDVDAVREALGRGLCEIVHLQGEGDPLPALAAALRETAPDVVFAGACGQGGEDTGLLPYALAHALGWPLVAHAVAVVAAPGGVRVTQALAKGARRHVTTSGPALVTMHPAAPPPLPFAFGRARDGRVAVRAAAFGPLAAPEGEARPYRARPRALAATPPPSAEGRLMIDPAPEAAAQAILAYLSEIGALSR